jgi:hypothetical protein
MEAKELLQALIEEREFCKKMQNSNGYIVSLGLATAHYDSDNNVVIAHVDSNAKAMAKADAERMLKEHFTSIKKGVLVAVTPKLEVASEWFTKRYESYKSIVKRVQENSNI